MSKRVKSIFLTGIGMIVFGLFVMGLALFGGGADELSSEVKNGLRVMTDSIEETQRLFPILRVFGNIEGVSVGIESGEFFLELNEAYEIYEGSYEKREIESNEEVSQMSFNMYSGSLRVEPSEDDSFYIESTDAQKYQCYVKEETLYLFGFPQLKFWEKEESEIVIYVPSECECTVVSYHFVGGKEEVNIPISSDEILISAEGGEASFLQPISGDTMKMEINSGDVNMAMILVNDLVIENGNGTLLVSECDAKTMQGRVGTGRIELTGYVSEKMILNCGFGSMQLKLTDSETAHNYDLSGTSNTIRVGAEKLTGLQTKRYIDNGSESVFEINCTMGEITLDFIPLSEF